MNRRACEADPGRSAQARPCDRRFGLAGVAILAWMHLIYADWGMRHMDVGTDMVIMPAMQNGVLGIFFSSF